MELDLVTMIVKRSGSELIRLKLVVEQAMPKVVDQAEAEQVRFHSMLLL